MGVPEDIVAWQLTLRFDTAQLTFETMEPWSPSITQDNFGTTHLQQGLLSISITTEGQVLTAETPLFSLVFKAKRPGRLRESLQISAWPTPALAFDATGHAWSPTLWATTQNSTVSFTPNPFGGSGTWLSVETSLEESNPLEGLLEILDVQGRVLFHKYLTTHQSIHIDPSIFPHQGMFFWRLNGGEKFGKLIFAP